ncbi:Uncharacterised protein g6038 [Pycnogonum litorale]
MYMFAYLIGMAYLALPVELGSPCPSPSAIVPCKCARGGTDTTIDCDYHNKDILESPIEAMSSRHMIIDNYRILSTRLEIVDDNYFKGILVRRVEFSCDRMRNITEKAFDGQQRSLSEVVIKKSQLTRLPVNALNLLEDLEQFTMTSSEVNEIEANAFDKAKSASVLHTLILSHNYIEDIGNNAFAKLTALKKLDLSGNHISQMASATLPGPSNRIAVLDLHNNQLTSVPGDLNTLPEEATVDLHKNGITDVESRDLLTMMQSKLYVDLKENALRCTCSFRILAKGAHYVNGVCKYPSILAGKKLISLKDSSFQHCFFYSRLVAAHMQ